MSITGVGLDPFQPDAIVKIKSTGQQGRLVSRSQPTNAPDASAVVQPLANGKDDGAPATFPMDDLEITIQPEGDMFQDVSGAQDV